MKIAVLVSGGVDSSVVLAKLHEQGHQLTAFYLKIWLEDELASLGQCPWEEDLAYVRALCDNLGVPLRVVPLQKEYHERIVQYTISEVQKGHTPSPDVLCNVRIKFGAFLDAIGDEFEKVASGHYAQVCLGASGLYELHQSPDPIKDQTYFLSHLSQQQLSRLLFPIGELTKEQVRAEAIRYQVPAKDRKDSQGICFLGKISFNQFLEHYLGQRSGDLVEEETGEVLGKHHGFWFHTIGQRKGIGLSGGPWYVVRKDTVKNIVFISRQYHEPEKKRDTFFITNVHFIGQRPEKNILSIKVRHGPEMVPATVTPQEDGRYKIELSKRDQGLAPGQFAVLYDGDLCLGCGSIDE